MPGISLPKSNYSLLSSNQKKLVDQEIGHAPGKWGKFKMAFGAGASNKREALSKKHLQSYQSTTMPEHPHLNPELKTQPLNDGTGEMSIVPDFRNVAKNPNGNGNSAFSDTTNMGRVAKNPEIDLSDKQHMAAKLIQRAWKAKKENPTIKRGEKVREMLGEANRADGFGNEQHLVNKARNERASESEDRLKSSRHIGKNVMQGNALNDMNVAPETNYSAAELEFIAKAKAQAKHVRANFYFHQDAANAILKSGALTSSKRRGGAGKGAESKTTEADANQLGTDDSVFFFLEHENAGMKKTRFTEQSTASGEIDMDALNNRKKNAGKEARISFPLQEVARQGAWAMKSDFLEPKQGTGKLQHAQTLAHKDNFAVAKGNTGQERAEAMMETLAHTALKQTRGSNMADARNALLGSDGSDLIEALNQHVMQTQFMVPGKVALNNPHARVHFAQKDEEYHKRSTKFK